MFLREIFFVDLEFFFNSIWCLVRYVLLFRNCNNVLVFFRVDCLGVWVICFVIRRIFLVFKDWFCLRFRKIWSKFSVWVLVNFWVGNMLGLFLKSFWMILFFGLYNLYGGFRLLFVIGINWIFFKCFGKVLLLFDRVGSFWII